MTQCARCAAPLEPGQENCPACGAPAPGRESPLGGGVADLRRHIDSVLGGKYEIVRELGRGGMGVVFLAHQKSLDRKICIKVLQPHLYSNAELVRRFQQEARQLSRLDHPNIVQILDVHDEGGLSFFLMPFIDGPSLREQLKADPKPPLPGVVRHLREIGSALAYAHRMGVIHRDVKPENVLIEPGTGRAILTDFGIAKAFDAAATAMTMTFTQIGSPRYMAPEQGENAAHVDGRSDQYGLGMIGYEMLAGRPCFDATNPAEILYQQKFEKPTPLDQLRPEAPVALRQALMRAIKKDRAERFATMDDFVAALEPEPVRTAAAKRGLPKSTGGVRAVRAGTGGLTKLGGRPLGIAASVVLLGIVGVGVTLALRGAEGKRVVPTSIREDAPNDQPTGNRDGANPGSRDGTNTGTQRGGVEPAGANHPEDPGSRGASDAGSSPPRASFVTPSEILTGRDAIFDAAGSSDLDDPRRDLEFRWDFEGDGRFDTNWLGTETASHEYASPGARRVVLEVRDPGGLTGRAERAIQVGSSPSSGTSTEFSGGNPGTGSGGESGVRASFASDPKAGTTSTQFRFDASASRDDFDSGASLEYRWDWDGDGVWDTSFGPAETASHAFDSVGRKRVRMEARNGSGQAAVASDIISVQAPSNPSEIIVDLIEKFRVAVQAEDFLALGANCYRGEVPNADRQLLKKIFNNAEKITVETGKQALEIGNDSRTIEARVSLRFRHAVSGESSSMKLRLSFTEVTKGEWKLLRTRED